MELHLASSCALRPFKSLFISRLPLTVTTILSLLTLAKDLRAFLLEMHLQIISTFAACALAASLNYNAPTIASTPSGSIEGLKLQNDRVNAYLGIPFAASPPERFSAPKDPKPWDGTLKAQKVKPACIQQFPGQYCCGFFL